MESLDEYVKRIVRGLVGRVFRYRSGGREMIGTSDSVELRLIRKEKS